MRDKLANYSSDDSEDEKPKKNLPKVADLSSLSAFEKMQNKDKDTRGVDREL